MTGLVDDYILVLQHNIDQLQQQLRWAEKISLEERVAIQLHYFMCKDGCTKEVKFWVELDRDHRRVYYSKALMLLASQEGELKVLKLIETIFTN